MSEQRTSASAVSAALRKGGLAVVAAHTRDGIYVQQSGSDVVVVASIVGQPRQEQVLSAEAWRILDATGRYRLTPSGYHDMSIFYVTRKRD